MLLLKKRDAMAFPILFFLNLPTEKERQDIFKVHLQKLRSSRLREFELPKLAKQSNHFSGAEIEQVIIDALHRAFHNIQDGQRRDLMTQDILQAIEDTVPLAAIASQQIDELKQWAAEAGARTASDNVELIEELKQYVVEQGISPLEVD